jgi:beta-lactamase class A
MNIRNSGNIQKPQRAHAVFTLSIVLSIFALEAMRFMGGINSFSFQRHPSVSIYSQQVDGKSTTVTTTKLLYKWQQTQPGLGSNTLGARNAALPTQNTVWTSEETVLLDTPESTQPLAHIGENFPLTLLGNTSWAQGQQWDHIAWSSPTHTWNGWVPDSTITFVPPQQDSSASFDALSPELASYLSSFSSNLGVSLYDVTNQRYYSYNDKASFLMASSAKVPIMFTYLDQLKQQGAEPNDQDINELTAMIENSDNDSASDLYSQITAPGMNAFLKKIGVSGMQANDDAWGYSTTTPLAMVHLLIRLYKGTILNPQDRDLAFNLMENIEADQRQGLGDTAPPWSTVAMKDGWVPDSNGTWAVNTSGIVMSGGEIYILSVYAQNQPSQEIGQNALQHVCSLIASSLL